MQYSTPYLRQLKDKGLRFPSVLCQIRTDEGREKRKQGIEVFRYKFLTPRTDGISNTLTGVQKDNLIITNTTYPIMELTYHPKPTKEDLLEYFSQRIRIRKMTPREALRLMDVDDADIDKMMNATETVTLKDGTTKTKKAISKTALYKLAGNSIVVSCLYHIFRTLFIPGQPENEIKQPSQLTPIPPMTTDQTNPDYSKSSKIGKDPINGIIIDGKVYEAVKCDSALQCKGCCFGREYCCSCPHCEVLPCRLFEGTYNFRFSQSLTDKINEK